MYELLNIRWGKWIRRGKTILRWLPTSTPSLAEMFKTGWGKTSKLKEYWKWKGHKS